MKRALLIALALLTYAGLSGQTTLKYRTHGLIADQINDMVITKYMEPGVSGKNVVWDFRTLEITKEFTGEIENSNLTKGSHLFTNANVALQEFNNRFYFNATKKGIEQYGYLSPSGNVYISYDVPFVKMKYPFTYGSAFTGPFSGSYNSVDKQLGTIEGTYLVEGDGIGTLMLPEGRVFENALRVKEVKEYDQVMNNHTYSITITTYRWYVETHRFPVLVLINSASTYENGKTYSSTQAAYNNSAVSKSATQMEITAGETVLDAYPNPYKEFITFRFALEDDAKITLSIFDISGRHLTTLYKGSADAGIKEMTFSGKEIGLGSGAYIAKLIVNGKAITKRIVEL